jgi:hypothetical protein
VEPVPKQRQCPRCPLLCSHSVQDAMSALSAEELETQRRYKVSVIHLHLKNRSPHTPRSHPFLSNQNLVQNQKILGGILRHRKDQETLSHHFLFSHFPLLAQPSELSLLEAGSSCP